MARSNAPILPPGGAAAANANSPTPAPANASVPSQPPYSGQNGQQVTPGGTTKPWESVVADARTSAEAALAQQPNAKDYAKIDDATTKQAYARAQLQDAQQEVTTTQTAYQTAVEDYNRLQTQAATAATSARGLTINDELDAAKARVDNTYNNYQAALGRLGAWQEALIQTLPSGDPTTDAINQATLVQTNIATKQAALNYDIYAGHARSDADHATEAAALQNESSAVDLALQQHGLSRATVDDAFTDATRAQALATGSFGPAKAKADIDYTAGMTAEAASRSALNYSNASSTAAKTPSEIDVNTSAAGLNNANKANVEAGIPNTIAAGSLTQQYVDAGYGTRATEKLAADTGSVEADTRGKDIANAQTQAGPDATFINQLGKAIADPTNPMNDTSAADLYFNHVYGGSQLERKQEANKQASGLLSTMATNGMVVSPGQQYIRGAEPGGTFANVMGRLGNTGYNPRPIHTFSAPAFAQSAGIDISPTQGLPTQSPFTDTGAPNPAFQSPNMAGNAPGFAGQVNGRKPPLVLGNMTPREYRARMAQQGGVQ